VIEGGNLKAQKSVEIECEVEGRATLVSLIPEGTFVKEGELLVELDSSDLEERYTQQEITYNSAEAAFVQAKESLEIQKNQNLSDISAAELNVLFAQKELDKYKEGDWPQTLRTMEDDIKLAEEERKLAQNRLKWTEELHTKGYVTSDELEADRLTLQRREINLEQAKEQKRISEVYDYPMEIKRLDSDVEESMREQERIKRRAASQLAQEEANLKSREAQFKLQKERFDKLKEQVEKCTIRAPQGGLVVYGEQGGDHRWGRGDSERVEEGAEVRFRQTLITLPDVSIMMVDTKVHESSVDQVEVGLDARVTVDAFPDLQFHGTVTKVAILPDSQSRWLNPDLKVYSTEVTLEDGSDKLKPGMSAKVEIIVERLEDAVHVPIQSVYRRGGREVCYQVTSDGDIEVRPVEVGFNNDEFVEILNGLTAGDQVLLYAPSIGEDVEEEVEEADERGERKGPEEKTEKKKEYIVPTGQQEEGRTLPVLTDRTGEVPEPKMEKEALEKFLPDRTGQPERPSSKEGLDQKMERGGFGSPNSPEAKAARERWMKMTPEERRAEMEKLMKEGKIPGQGRRGPSREGKDSKGGK
jgi:HlyD family secretion protein